MINRYARKPPEVEAVQYNGFNAGEVAEFITGVTQEPEIDENYEFTVGSFIIEMGDFAIKDSDSNFTLLDGVSFITQYGTSLD